MAPLKSHSQIRAEVVALLVSWVWWHCHHWTVSRPWGRHSGLGCSPREQQSCWTGRLKQWSLIAWDGELCSTRWRYQALPQLDWGFLALGTISQAALEALCRPLLGSGGLCWATYRGLRQCHRLTSVRVCKPYQRDPVTKRNDPGTNGGKTGNPATSASNSLPIPEDNVRPGFFVWFCLFPTLGFAPVSVLPAFSPMNSHFVLQHL